MARPIRIIQCMSSWFACFPKDGRISRHPSLFLALLCLHDKRFSFFCAVLCALEAEDQETLALLRSLHPEVDQAYELVQQFARMLRTRTGEQLDNWLERVKTSKIRELQGLSETKQQW